MVICSEFLPLELITQAVFALLIVLLVLYLWESADPVLFSPHFNMLQMHWSHLIIRLCKAKDRCSTVSRLSRANIGIKVVAEILKLD